MTSPALNSASIAPAAAAARGASASASTAPGGAAAGFDALMAALFPQGAPAADAKGAQPTMAADAPAKGLAAPEGETEAAPAAAEVQGSVEGAVESAVGDDATAALVASLATAQPAAPQAAAATAKDAAAAPPAWGRDKPAGAAAQPALAHANPKAELTTKAEPGIEGAEPDGEPPPNPAERPAQPALPPQASTQARATVAAAVPAAPPAPPPADTAGDAPPPAPAPADLAQAEAADANAPAIATQSTAAASLAARPEAAQPVRPAKAERARVGAEASSNAGLKPLEASSKPVFAKAAEGAAKAASASVEAAESKPAEVQGEADSPDTVQSFETRGAAQSSAPAAHAAQVVRGSPETVATLAAQIVKKLEGQSTRFDVELDPAGLGRVDVRVEIGAHGRVTAALTFDNPQAAQDLKARSGELQRALEQAGFDLSGGLSFDVAGDRGRQGQAWQEQADGGRAFQGQAFRQALDTAGEADAAANQGALRLRRGVSAGLDLRI